MYLSRILLTLLLALPLALSAQKLTVKYRFLNIEEGYDHTTKTAVFVDGEEMGISNPHPQSKPGSLIVDVPTGRHDIRVVNYALYEGTWEEHTVENQYSIDCIVETVVRIKKKATIDVTFDLNSETSYTVKAK
ncbi:MAG: hypothetical protein NW241_16555 [Bacteroidia bacterium]|nr:hypothetical protein [Bacteroidia bacterium]